MGTVPVQSACYQFLASSRFTVDQHRDVGMGEATNSPKYFLHCRRRTNNFGRCTGGFNAELMIALLGLCQCSLSYRHHFFDIEGFGQVLKSTPLVGLNGTVQIGVGRGDDHRQPRM